MKISKKKIKNSSFAFDNIGSKERKEDNKKCAKL